MIHLEPVTRDNIDELIGLTVRKDQESFVSSVAESLAQAYVYSDTAYPFAVYETDVLVGFIMMGYYQAKHYYTLWKFLIDQRYQNKGYGRQALELGLEYIRGKFNTPDIYTGVAPGNMVAKNLYRSVGFEDTGLIECGMEEMKLSSVIHRTATGQQLAGIAKTMAQIPLHGFTDGERSNLEPIIHPFPKWTLEEADGLWCAAFVYYCCREAGFEIPIRPDECKSCHLAGCIAWEEFATGDPRIEYHTPEDYFVPESGVIVLYDRVFENKEHDHIGIVIENQGDTIIAAEGNIDNRSGIVGRPIDGHIRAYIRIPDGYKYSVR
jgi:RimJ/RimL family protein N-acetyltransferase